MPRSKEQVMSRRKFSIAIAWLVLGLLTLQAAPRASAQKAKVPEEAAIEKSTQEVAQLFQTEFQRAVTDDQKNKLAQQLIGDRGPGKPVVNSIGMKLALLPAGEFQMGSPGSDSDANGSEIPWHRVKITKPFYLSVHEVTQQQYEKVMKTRPWQGKDYVKEGADYPAVYVNHDDAVEFCRRLSKQEGVEFRLPTEAEWEYACRGGTTTIYSFGDDAARLGQYAWYIKNAWDVGEKYGHRVGQKLSNPWGLYDMHGNVYEWCQDRYGPYGSEKGVIDPLGSTQGIHRVLRGGAFNYPPKKARSANRNNFQPDYRSSDFGFRVARPYSLSD
jgi:formylglycine-generating enzyme required for sulfatase activity